MNKYYGAVGFAVTAEDPPGSDIWTETITEHKYYGDILRNYQRIQTADRVNGDPILANRISIVADPFAWSNYQNIRYAKFLGAKHRVTDVEVQYPRLILSLGGVFNEQST